MSEFSSNLAMLSLLRSKTGCQLDFVKKKFFLKGSIFKKKKEGFCDKKEGFFGANG